MSGVLKGSCPMCNNKEVRLGGTVRESGNTHYICDPTLRSEDIKDDDGNIIEEGRYGCNVQFYIQGIDEETRFEDREIHFPFNVIFRIPVEGEPPSPRDRGKYNFYRKPCIWTVPPNRIVDADINCRRGCPDECHRVHCPKNPARPYCIDPITKKPSDPPCDLYPNCDCERAIPGDMWQCIWSKERKCPDMPGAFESLLHQRG